MFYISFTCFTMLFILC
uniref:Uncharacterized protein n=1 Tax=Anguilla anguilla TaxID=7936 RepID=A0A0E9VSE1_ANGAN